MQQLRSKVQSLSSKESTPMNIQKQWLISLPTSTICILSFRLCRIPNVSKQRLINYFFCSQPIYHYGRIQNSSEYCVAASLRRLPISKPKQLREANSKSIRVMTFYPFHMQFVMFTSLWERIILFGRSFRILVITFSPNNSQTILPDFSVILSCVLALTRSKIFLYSTRSLSNLLSLILMSLGLHSFENTANWVTMVRSISCVTSVSEMDIPSAYYWTLQSLSLQRTLGCRPALASNVTISVSSCLFTNMLKVSLYHLKTMGCGRDLQVTLKVRLERPLMGTREGWSEGWMIPRCLRRSATPGTPLNCPNNLMLLNIEGGVC